MNSIYRFFIGRYGIDPTFFVLGVLEIILIILGSLLRIFGFGIAYLVISLLRLMLLGYMIFRVLSKNIDARAKENRFVMGIIGRFRTGSSKKNRVKKDDRVVVICPSCKANIRVRNIKGKHGVECPRCHMHFDVHI